MLNAAFFVRLLSVSAWTCSRFISIHPPNKEVISGWAEMAFQAVNFCSANAVLIFLPSLSRFWAYLTLHNIFWKYGRKILQNQEIILPCLAHIVSYNFIKASIICEERIMAVFLFLSAHNLKFELRIRWVILLIVFPIDQDQAYLFSFKHPHVSISCFRVCIPFLFNLSIFPQSLLVNFGVSSKPF